MVAAVCHIRRAATQAGEGVFRWRVRPWWRQLLRHVTVAHTIIDRRVFGSTDLMAASWIVTVGSPGKESRIELVIWIGSH